MQAWLNKAMASYGVLSCGFVSAGRLSSIYLDNDLESKMLPTLIDMMKIREERFSVSTVKVNVTDEKEAMSLSRGDLVDVTS